jgi:glycosyltransferase involved in cell wall biosynthesis
MQEIKKRRIVIASVLKPVDDPRMFEKMARSLAKEHEIHVIGFPASSRHVYTGITQHPLPALPRLSIRRLIRPWQILRMVLTLRPEAFIITTHELLFMALLAKWCRRLTVVYDVQENYFRNILFTDAFPRLLRGPLACYVRLKELVMMPVIDRFILAEKAYADEMRFLRKKSVVLENKYAPSAQPPGDALRTPDQTTLLFSGTLSHSTGVFAAIELAKGLHALDPSIRLIIVGYAPKAGDASLIRRIIQPLPFITLIGGDQLVDHREIVTWIRRCDFGVISYPVSPATSGSIPTKLYEYLANTLPVLCVDHPRWVRLITQYNAGVSYSPDLSNLSKCLAHMKSQAFYPTPPPADVLWASEEPRLLDLFR